MAGRAREFDPESIPRLLRFTRLLSFRIVENELTEPIKRRVGGSLTRLPPLERLAMLRRNARLLRAGKWLPPQDDGTLVRKVVGLAR
jgi:hypothetical protein